MPDYADSSILPFGTSSNAPTEDLAPIKLFGCTVIDFNVSADWSSQGGSLNCRLIEADSDGDRLKIPVLGSPVLFELKRRADGRVLFQYIGIVDSFSRNASNNSKTYSATLSSPLKILDATTVIMDGYVGFGGIYEGSPEFSGLVGVDYGHKNGGIAVGAQYNFPAPPETLALGINHWWNVCNLINVYGLLENDDLMYRVPTFNASDLGLPGTPRYGGYGFSGRSKDGIPLIKLMWALHLGINHVPPSDTIDPLTGVLQRQKSLGGNLLYGRHNYNIYNDAESVPYYYHFDAIDFYNQIVDVLGPQFRVEGEYKTLRELIAAICDEANLEFFSYIDIYNPTSIGTNGQIIGDPTLQDSDKNWGPNAKAKLNWPQIAQGWSRPLYPTKFTQKMTANDTGNYGGTIRIKVINKNTFFNKYRPYSNIAFNLIGLEVPDLKDNYDNVNDYRSGQGIWGNTANAESGAIHPGRRPVNDINYGLVSNLDGRYSEPLDSSGIHNPSWGFMHEKGTAEVGTMSVANGGYFPVQETGYDNRPVLFDSNKLDDLKIKSSDISIKLNDFTTMKVVTGGYQSRIVHVSGDLLRHYWGDILVTGVKDPRVDFTYVNDVETDALGLNEDSNRKVPVVTPLLNPKDIDDFILIDMKSEFGNTNVTGVLEQGVYAASMFEIRCAMSSFESWKAFMENFKYQKIRNIVDAFYTETVEPSGSGQPGASQSDLKKSTDRVNAKGGLGYVAVCDKLGLGNLFALNQTPNDLVSANNAPSGGTNIPPGSGKGLFGLGINISKTVAELAVKENILPPIHQKIKEIGDLHYGKSWYAPVPYCKSMEDLDGNNLVGNFKRSWELAGSAYAEPATYYDRRIPQSNMFVSDGKVSPFVNYDNNFIADETGFYDQEYVTEITNLMGREQNICNFSEYNIDELCITRYSTTGNPAEFDDSGNVRYGVSGHDIIHAAPKSVSETYAFLPFGYDLYYNRYLLPFSDAIYGTRKKFDNQRSSEMAPLFQGQRFTPYQGFRPNNTIVKTVSDSAIGLTPSTESAVFGYSMKVPDVSAPGGLRELIPLNSPAITSTGWLPNAVTGITELDYSDNGRFSIPFVKFTTERVFLPVPAPEKNNGELFISDSFNVFLDAQIKYNNGQYGAEGSRLPNNTKRQHLLTEDKKLSVLNPFQECVVPKSFNYPQISTRYIYGPWMTALPSGIAFRGKIEYEQDESLVPENFLIPTNFGKFGGYELKQTSGLRGLDLAAQGRANSIDEFSLFAVEEGSITMPGAPAITRIGDDLFGIQQVTDIRISVNNDRIETSYGFKTISPKYGKNPRDLEKKLTKISNDIKKLKLR